jgi:hypothetical protein
MSAKQKTTYICFLCGGALQTGPEYCTVNFHPHNDLKLNEKGNGYAGFYQQGVAHLVCIEQYSKKTGLGPMTCVVCEKPINGCNRMKCSKAAIYQYRKRGCLGVLGVHNQCLRQIKIESFPFARP